jgi:hypothetical protein
MVTIIERTYGDGTDKRLKLTAQEAIRPMSIGSDWGSILIGMRFNITDLGASMTGTPRLAIGVCHGTAHGYSSISTAHWIGVRTAAATWSRNADGYYSHGGTTSLELRRKVGATVDGAANGSPTSHFTMWNDLRSIMVLRLTKVTETTMSASLLHRTSSASLVDISLSTFLSVMESSTTTLTSYTRTGLTISASTIAFDEAANGALNCVSIAWSRSDTDLEISDVVVTRTA